MPLAGVGGAMILDFAWLPPEINSMRIFSGAGPGPLHAAALAWDGLAADLAASASSFNAVITGLTGGQWTGPASAAMAAAALPYQDWITTAADQADATAGLARTAASAFEGALTATVHPAVVDANRVSLMTLIATNFLGFNTPAIAANEFDYAEMWAQDVAAMVSYHGGATAVAASLTPFAAPPVDLASLAANIGAQFTGLATMASAAISPALQGVTGAAPGLVAGAQSAASALPIQSIASVAQLGAMPASMIMGPLMQAGQSATAGTAGLASATTGVGDPTKSVGDTAPSMKGLGGGAGLGAGTSGSLGQARMVGAMSVPPTWVGSAPKGMASSAMHGLGATPTAASPPAGSPTGGGMPMMPMPMGAGGAGAGMPGGMMGRGGASPHLTQNRPSVIPRTGIG